MTNGEKYKTAKDRSDAFLRYCECKSCNDCELNKKRISTSRCNDHVCLAFWLDLEAYEEEKPLPCMWCKSEMQIVKEGREHFLSCVYCNHTTMKFYTKEELVSEYNSLAKKCMEGRNDK